MYDAAGGMQYFIMIPLSTTSPRFDAISDAQQNLYSQQHTSSKEQPQHTWSMKQDSEMGMLTKKEGPMRPRLRRLGEYKVIGFNLLCTKIGLDHGYSNP